MPTFKPAYLIHGDDHGRIAERRARLRAIAEAESGSGGVEVFEGDAATPETIALALRSMTFAIGRRFLIVDSVERWKDADVESVLAPALAGIAPDTTVAFFAREDGRTKAPAKLAAAVKGAGGDVAAESALKPRELPRWVVAEGERVGIKVEGAAAKALVAQVGDRQQRLRRELEKLALEHGEGATIGVEEVEGAAALSAERQIWGRSTCSRSRTTAAPIPAWPRCSSGCGRAWTPSRSARTTRTGTRSPRRSGRSRRRAARCTGPTATATCASRSAPVGWW